MINRKMENLFIHRLWLMQKRQHRTISALANQFRSSYNVPDSERSAHIHSTPIHLDNVPE